MAFYSEFSEHYETVFPFRQPVLEFLNRWLPATGKILDIGCGTGSYCGPLAGPERPGLGIDLDAQMIQEAENNYPQVKFSVLDMAGVGTLPKQQFAGIYCIGNVLPHLPAGQLKVFLGHLKQLLIPGGVWIFQTVNFDPIIGQGDYQFPVREFPEKDLQFHRQYIDQDDGSLLFQTKLVEAGQELFQGAVPLYPRSSTHCLDRHQETGFEFKGHFADFSEKPFTSSEHSGSVFVFNQSEES